MRRRVRRNFGSKRRAKRMNFKRGRKKGRRTRTYTVSRGGIRL